MKYLIIILALCLVLTVNSQTVMINHTNYTTTWSDSLGYPLKVEWYETITRDGCKSPLPRKDKFAPDPLRKAQTDLQKYYEQANIEHKAKGLKGFDRGHMCPAASNECQTETIEDECFYFSNMAPQYHALNAGDWKTLETLSRNLALQYDSVHIWAGSIGIKERFGSLTIPSTCWKVIYILRTKEYQAYIFDNKDQKQTGLSSHKVQLIDVIKLTGYTFE